MMIKIFDENETLLHCEEVVGNVAVSAHDFALAHAPDNYILKDVIVINNNGSNISKKIFEDPMFSYGGDMVVIEVEKV